MKTENVIFMQMARESLKEKWGFAAGVFAVYLLVVVSIQTIPFIGQVALLILSGPLVLGLTIFTLSLSRNEEAKLEQVFQGFNNFSTALVTYLLMLLFVLLWALLLIVPGIIAALSYSMTFYILADDDSSIEPMEALTKSKKMMDGYKWKLFCLGCRFIGWLLLCIPTLGIGLLWLLPYMHVSVAKFYDELKANTITIEFIETEA